MHEASEEREVKTCAVYVTDFGDIEFPDMPIEKADAWYRAEVTRYWFLLGDKVEAEKLLVQLDWKH